MGKTTKKPRKQNVTTTPNENPAPTAEAPASEPAPVVVPADLTGRKFKHSVEVEIEHKRRIAALEVETDATCHAAQIAAAKAIGPAVNDRDKIVIRLREARDRALSQLRNDEIQAQKAAQQRVRSEFENKRNEITGAYEASRTVEQTKFDKATADVEPTLRAAIAAAKDHQRRMRETLNVWFEATIRPLREAEAQARAEAEAARAADERAADAAQANAKQVAESAGASATAPAPSAP